MPFPRATVERCDCRMWPLRRSLVGLSVVAVMLATALGAAACSPTPARSTLCLPEPRHVNPPQVAAGWSLAVASAPFKCGGAYPTGKKYHLTLGLVGRQLPMDLGSYPVNRDGSFAATVPIPANASPGEAAIVVHGSPFDQCDASGQGSCAGYGASFTIIPAIQ